MTPEEWAHLRTHPEIERLIEYAEWLKEQKGYHTTAAALVEVARAGISRVEQLRRYAEKKKDPNATFRPYAPLKLSAKHRGDAKRAAVAEGVAPVKDSFPWRCTVRESIEVAEGEYTKGRRCMLPTDHNGAHEF